MTEAELRAEVERMRAAMRGIAGCSTCSACRDVAMKFVATPWKKVGD